MKTTRVKIVCLELNKTPAKLILDSFVHNINIYWEYSDEKEFIVNIKHTKKIKNTYSNIN